MEERFYSYKNSIVFKKTKERHGGLSNMAGGYPIIINGVNILTSEALYQSCRYPHMPEVQKMIIDQRSPMTAKMKSKPYRKQSREDWDEVRVKVMRWCLRVKLIQNWDKFSQLLRSTGDLPIVEESNKDSFWGAIPNGDYLKGVNCLGRLLMELRDELPHIENSSYILKPIEVENFLLFNKIISPIKLEINDIKYKGNTKLKTQKEQLSLFDPALPTQANIKKDIDHVDYVDEILNIFNELFKNNSKATIYMVDYFMPKEVVKKDLFKLTEKVLYLYGNKPNRNKYFIDSLLEALLSKEIKTSTKSLIGRILLKIVVTKEHKQELMKSFAIASLNTPNPLGSYFYSIVKRVLPNNLYLDYYKQSLRTVARSSSLSSLYGQGLPDSTIAKILDMFHNEASPLISLFKNQPVKVIINEIIGKLDFNFPIDPFRVCNNLGIKVIYVYLPDTLDGFTFKNVTADRGLIVLNQKNKGSKREMFTLSHELAHFLLHDFSDAELINVNNGYYANISNKSNWEKEANQFAEMLLIPSGSKGHWILKDLEPPFVPKIYNLSDQWKISSAVILSGFAKFAQYPVKVSIIKENEIIYTVKSDYWGFESDESECQEESFETSNNITYEISYYK